MRIVIIAFIGLLFIASCTVESAEDSNPYRTWDESDSFEVADSDKLIDPTSIAGLHKNIFKPTCANSGCHDGSFEPDFRTIESSYYSMVNVPIVKNKVDGSFEFRVVPGNSAMSMLRLRMEEDLNGNSGIMPLVTEPNSDYPGKKEEYIDNIKTWIDNGAKDQFGNTPEQINFPPQLQGMIGFTNGGGTQVFRAGFYNPIEVPIGAGGVDLWIAYSDDKTPVSNFGVNDVLYTIDPYGWDSAKTAKMQIQGTPKTEKGFYKTEVDYYHKVHIPFTGYKAEDVLWIRTFVSDNQQDTTEIPNDNSIFNARKYFTVKIK
jgi:hypothetical protein